MVRNKEKSIPGPAKAAFWFAACSVVNKGLSLFATPVLTRIMSTEQYGTFSVFQSWVSIVSIFCTLNLFGAAYSRGRLDFKGRESEFESSLLALSTVLTGVFALAFLLAPDFWSGVMGLSPFLSVMVFVEIVFTSATAFWSARQRFEYRYRSLVVVTIATNAFSLGVGIAAIMMTDAKVEARVVTDVIAKSVPGLVLMALIFFRGRCLFNRRYWKFGLKFTLPLLPHFLSHYVLNQSDRLMIGRIVGNGAAALYSVSYSISMALVIVVTAINDSYCPYTFQKLDSGEVEGVRRVGYAILAFIGSVTLLVMAFAPEILRLFAGPEYYDAVSIVPPLSASVYFIFLYSMNSNVEYYFKSTGPIAAASAVAAVLNIALNLVFIPAFGYKAAAWTTLAAYIALSFMHGVFSFRIARDRLGDQIYRVRNLVLMSVGVLAASLLMLTVLDMPVIRYAIVVAILVAMIIKRKTIAAVLRRKGE